VGAARQPSAVAASAIARAANSSPRSQRSTVGTPPKPRAESTVTAIRSAASTSAAVGRSDSAQPTISREY
jgi:hypothetical protein